MKTQWAIRVSKDDFALKIIIKNISGEDYLKTHESLDAHTLGMKLRVDYLKNWYPRITFKTASVKILSERGLNSLMKDVRNCK